jgi:formylglycine-generating enzyme
MRFHYFVAAGMFLYVAAYADAPVPAGGMETPVKPPKLPHISEELDEDSAAALPALKQPQALAVQLDDLSKGSTDERIAKLRKKVLNDLVFVHGGSFMMGDFGEQRTPEGLPYTPESDNKPAHKVTLTSFSISKYKTTYAEFDVFTDATKTPKAGMETYPTYQAKGRYRFPTIPVGTYWQPAKDYCRWLGKITGQPFDLPTEAQWEYAARSGGQFFIFATDNGSLDIGRNIDSPYQYKTLSPFGMKVMGDLYPIGLFPPNPIGLFDMNHDGHEWVNDWYGADYYAHSPENNPSGPKTGTKRVLRSYGNLASLFPGLNMLRWGHSPVEYGKDPDTQKSGPGDNVEDSVRCAVQQDHPVQFQ